MNTCRKISGSMASIDFKSWNNNMHIPVLEATLIILNRIIPKSPIVRYMSVALKWFQHKTLLVPADVIDELKTVASYSGALEHTKEK